MDAATNILMVFMAGVASVMSPCVLPVVPIVVTGTAHDHRFRPLMIVMGLAFTFVIMGILSSLFGAAIGPLMQSVEKIAAVLIFLLGALLALQINLFKHVRIFSRLAALSSGRSNGFALGAVLGFIWIPCIGPVLSGVLAMVASEGRLLTGVTLLAIYSLGFSVPLLIAGYASHFFRTRLRALSRFPSAVNIASGLLLMALGAFIFMKGMVGFGF